MDSADDDAQGQAWLIKPYGVNSPAREVFLGTEEQANAWADSYGAADPHVAVAIPLVHGGPSVLTAEDDVRFAPSGTFVSGPIAVNPPNYDGEDICVAVDDLKKRMGVES